jgi:hypothetical protein
MRSFFIAHGWDSTPVRSPTTELKAVFLPAIEILYLYAFSISRLTASQ